MSSENFSDFLLAVETPWGVTQKNLIIDFGPKNDRFPHSNKHLESSISLVWERRTSLQPLIYNGSKFRYSDSKLVSTTDGDDQRSEPKVKLFLGFTDYKTFVGTNLNPNWEHFISKEKNFLLWQHMACPLGNLAVVQTSDSKIIVLERSDSVGEAPLCPVFPGGHSEPTDVGIYGHLEKETRETLILTEFFFGILREVEEETGIDQSLLSSPLFLGISIRRVNLRPVAAFVMKCLLDSSQVLENYSSAKHKFESIELNCVTLDELFQLTPKMPGCHRGGAELFRKWLQLLKS